VLDEAVHRGIQDIPGPVRLLKFVDVTCHFVLHFLLS
jgi:hypothetical protein